MINHDILAWALETLMLEYLRGLYTQVLDRLKNRLCSSLCFAVDGRALIDSNLIIYSDSIAVREHGHGNAFNNFDAKHASLLLGQ